MDEPMPSWLFSEMSFRRCLPAGKMGDACIRFAATLTFILQIVTQRRATHYRQHVVLCCTSVLKNDRGPERSLNAIGRGSLESTHQLQHATYKMKCCSLAALVSGFESHHTTIFLALHCIAYSSVKVINWHSFLSSSTSSHASH